MNQARKLLRAKQRALQKVPGAPGASSVAELPNLLKRSVEATEAIVEANRALSSENAELRRENADLRERIRKLDTEVSLVLQEHEKRLTALDGGKEEEDHG